ncbi:M24 family metallopeptidase [Bradyrhizobium sp. Pha-3]|uniref:M24 family metallopeptidase n=1 Tax=Bradyrhizobium sp. Pha-3 TaxID=208375 RepID=UPI0035D4FDB9
MAVVDHPRTLASPSFDAARLDALMERQGFDVIVATSRHNVQYLLGGYRFFCFESTEAMGVNCFLPIVIYWKGRSERSAYVGSGMEKLECDRGTFHDLGCFVEAGDSKQAIERAIDLLRQSGLPARRIGIEASFIPSEAKDALVEAFPQGEILNAHRTLELLRAVKTSAEIDLLRRASDGVVESILAVFSEAREGMTKHQLIELARREQFSRGVDFKFCQASMGASLDRTPTDQILSAGDVVSLDCVGQVAGYIGDICRMGLAGEPDAELQDILGFVDQVQKVVRGKVCAGVIGGDLITAGDVVVRSSPYARTTDFTVHGLGLVSHESPRLAHGRPLPYPPSDAELPIEAGMVLSIETAVKHPARGFIKLEDTVVATELGNVALGDIGRGWNRIHDW